MLLQVKCSTDLPFELFMTKVLNHDQIKKEILQAIKLQGSYSFINDAQCISNTDWHLSSSFNRPYIEVTRFVILEHLENLRKHFNYDAVKLTNYWFQQYKKGDYHSEHTHSGCSFSNIYYVDLDKNSPKTNFSYKGKFYSVDVEEGNILTFPSFLIHFSPENKSNHIKTVISFNADAIRDPSKIHPSYK